MLFTALFMFILQRNVTPNGVMVGCIGCVIYSAVVCFQVLARQNVVYADIQVVLVVGNTHSIARFNKCIVQFILQDMVGV